MGKLENRKRSLPIEKLEVAKTMYMDHSPITVIAREMSVPRTTIQYYVNSSWKEERDAFSNELIKNMSTSRYSDLAEVYTYAVKALKRCIREVAVRREMISTKEATDIVKILDVLDKLTKEGKNPLEELEENAIEVEYGDVDPFYKKEKDKGEKDEGEKEDEK